MNTKGFTLIELIVVIVLMSLLAVSALPKISAIDREAHEARFLTVVSSFRQAVKHVHLAWLVDGRNTAIQDFIDVTNPLAQGDLSVNKFGYPVDTRGNSLTLNTQNDCIDVWHALMVSEHFSVAHDQSQTFRVWYDGNGACTYFYNALPDTSFIYDSTSGKVTVSL